MRRTWRPQGSMLPPSSGKTRRPLISILPWTLVPAVWDKLAAEGVRGMLVAPEWTGASWWPRFGPCVASIRFSPSPNFSPRMALCVFSPAGIPFCNCGWPLRWLSPSLKKNRIPCINPCFSCFPLFLAHAAGRCPHHATSVKIKQKAGRHLVSFTSRFY